MANTNDNASKYLAINIIALREKRGLTQSALSLLANVPRSTITHIESGAGNPSLSNLAKVAAALQVSIEELIARPRANCKLIKANELTAVKRAQGAALILKLLPDSIPGMEIDRMEISLKGRMGGIPHVAGTKEYFTCVQGEVTVQVAGEAYRVQEGDVLAFPGDQAHSYSNTGKKLAIAFSVVALAPAGI